MALNPFLSTTDAARYLGVVTPQSLHKWRSRGQGPCYLRIGRKVFYRQSDLDIWLTETMREPAATN